MDFHPIIVHFPIALLVVYCALEFLRFEKLQKQAPWFYLKLFLLLTGTAFAGLALQTGEFAEGKYDRAMRQIIRLHSSWASIATAIFALLAFAYLLKWLEKDFADDSRVLKLKSIPVFNRIFRVLNRIAVFIGKTPITLALAASGFLAMAVTGALGSVVVHGPESDIFVSFFYHLFF